MRPSTQAAIANRRRVHMPPVYVVR
jgi:hypothetical protein